jgi:hypothetical protein
MGYDTSLVVDGEVLLMWRKQAGALPRLLFRPGQAVVDLPPAPPEEGVRSPEGAFVGFRTTAGEVLATLDESGLGWAASVAAYGATRFTGFSAGMIMGEAWARAEDDTAVERLLAEFEQLPPERDLAALGAVLAAQLAAPPVDGIVIFGEILYDGPLESVSKTVRDVYEQAASMDGVDVFAAARAAESWAVLYRDAPLLAWPMLVCVLLHQLPAEAEVVLDLTDDAFETADIESADDARGYLDDYWSWTTEALASSARTLGRLFTALASFDSKLAPEFWFARAAGLNARMKALAVRETGVTTKERGDALEALVEALLRTEEPNLQPVERNYRTREEEIDVLVTNGLTDPWWAAHGSPLILIECKNKKAKASVPDLRTFESKVKDRGALCKIGIFVSVSGFAATTLQRLKSFQAEGGIIFAVSGSDLDELIATKTKLSDWLRGPGVVRSLGK